MTEKIIGIAVLIVLAIFMSLLLILPAGCNEAKKKLYSDPNIAVQDLTLGQRDNVIAYKNAEIELAAKEKVLADLRAFRIQMLWLVLGAGVIAIFWKPAIGIPLAVLFGAMIGFAQALMDYSLYIGWASMGLGALMVSYVIWLKHDALFLTGKALKEVVDGNQLFKKIIEGTAPVNEGGKYMTVETFKSAQKDVQSPITTKLVSAIRKGLPNK